MADKERLKLLLSGEGSFILPPFTQLVPPTSQVVSFVKHAASSGKKFLKSELGKDIINDTIASAATAATSALLEQDPTEARNIMQESLKRSQDKSKAVVKRIARDKLDQVLTGRGKKRKKVKVRRQKCTLLDL